MPALGPKVPPPFLKPTHHRLRRVLRRPNPAPRTRLRTPRHSVGAAGVREATLRAFGKEGTSAMARLRYAT
ncbi:hypothetical protein IQ07DRAFT_588334 [Pyrenochaeta sp. DS3sAY3a]|nr:hypothetical protein IQ07DRAFT_588334 [Pyrenochaeta sp. DS3sAY3a]